MKLPKEIIDAAYLLENYFTESGDRWWRVAGVCSRNFSNLIENLEEEMQSCEDRDYVEPHEIWRRSLRENIE